MQRPVIEDVLDVLQEARRIAATSDSALGAFRLRQEAIQTVSTRELGKGRFANEASAQHSIQDACSRRLDVKTGPKIAAFDDALDLLLQGEPARMAMLLSPVPKDKDQEAAVTRFLAPQFPEQGSVRVPSEPNAQPPDIAARASAPW